MAEDAQEKRSRVARKRAQPAVSENPRPRSSAATAETLALHASFEPGGSGPRLAPRPAADPVRLPPITDVHCFNTSRLLPSKYSESVLTRIADDPADLQQIFALDSATNDRLLAEGGQRLGITARELVFDVPYCRIINAAFTHPHPQGARFSMPYRGAWYAGLELATAKTEVLFHRAVQFAEIGWQQIEELEYDQYTADFSGCFHDLRSSAFTRADPPGSMHAAGARHKRASLEHIVLSPRTGLGVEALGGVPPETYFDIRAAEAPPTAAEFASCLALSSYIASQQLAIHLLEAGSLGILYPSARRQGGSCIACFRPSLVANVRKRDLYCLRWYPDRPATFTRSQRTLAPAEAIKIGAMKNETMK